MRVFKIVSRQRLTVEILQFFNAYLFIQYCIGRKQRTEIILQFSADLTRGVWANLSEAMLSPSLVCVWVCVCVCYFSVDTYFILILRGLRGPLTLRWRRGQSGLLPGMACTEHSTKRHTVTQKDKQRQREEKIQIDKKDEYWEKFEYRKKEGKKWWCVENAGARERIVCSKEIYFIYTKEKKYGQKDDYTRNVKMVPVYCLFLFMSQQRNILHSQCIRN